jgi:hypothetical protein
MGFTFVYLPLAETVLTDAEWQVVEQLLLDNPAAGAVISGTGGVRKLRVAFANRGKRGSARTIYLHVDSQERIYFLLAYAKNVQENLTNDQKRQIRAVVEQLKG